MKKRTNYYVNRSNPLVWLSAALMIGAAVARIASYRLYGLDNDTTALFVFQILLSVFSMALFVLTLFVHGPTRIYRIAVPIILGCVCFAYRATTFELWHQLFCWLLYLVIAVVFTATVSGHVKSRLLALLAFGLPLAVHLFQDIALEHFHTPAQWLPESSVLLIMASALCLLLALRRRPDDGKYYPTWGDRSDGRRLRTLPPMSMVSPYIMVNRNGSSNLIRDSVEITELEGYIRKKRKEGLSGFGMQHIFVAAYVRAVSQYPGINRFLAGQKVYAREGVEISMTIKKEMSVDSPDTLIDLMYEPSATADEVYRQFNDAVEQVKNSPLDSSFDKTAGVISMIPSVLLKFVIWLLKLLDYFGLLPNFLLRISPFHGSMFITSMGSLGIPPIYHHLYDFGNLPVFISFGAKRRVNEVQSDGSVGRKKYIDFTVVTDERICDGFYYATALKYIKRLMMHPEQLDVPPEKVVRDID
jgi:hypothetical protein